MELFTQHAMGERLLYIIQTFKISILMIVVLFCSAYS